MKQNAALPAGRNIHPDEYMRFVNAASKQAKCRACGMPIPAGLNHLCFSYQDAGWRRSFRLCRACLEKIMRAIKRKPKPAKKIRKEPDAIAPNIALPGMATFDRIKQAAESSPPGAAHAAHPDGKTEVCEQCGRSIEGECPECDRRRREWF